MRVLLALPMQEGTKVMDAIRSIARHPSQQSNDFGRDQVGRLLHAITIERHEIVFWVDHAAKEIRIVGVSAD